MNSQIKLNSASEVPNNLPKGTPPGPTDADNQALWDLGQLQFLANYYESLVSQGSPQPQTNDTLASFQKLYSYYHFNSDGTITFDYNEGQQNLPANFYSTILNAIPKLSNPPTPADIATYQQAYYSNTKIDGQHTLIELMLLDTYDAQYSMADNLQNTITNTSLAMFYLSLVNAPGNIAAGTLDDLLSEGYYDGAMFNAGNIRAMAYALVDHVANDSTILSESILLGGLQIATKDQLYPVLAQYVQQISADGSRESNDWYWESFFFPVFVQHVQKEVNFIPDKENTILQNELELEEQAMKKKENPDVQHRRISIN